jgi:hypothetical protein
MPSDHPSTKKGREGVNQCGGQKIEVRKEGGIGGAFQPQRRNCYCIALDSVEAEELTTQKIPGCQEPAPCRAQSF